MKPDAIMRIEAILLEERCDAYMRGLQYVLDELDMTIEPKSTTKAGLLSEIDRIHKKL